MVMVPFRDLGAVGTENQLLALKAFGVVDPPLFVCIHFLCALPSAKRTRIYGMTEFVF